MITQTKQSEQQSQHKKTKLINLNVQEIWFFFCDRYAMEVDFKGVWSRFDIFIIFARALFIQQWIVSSVALLLLDYMTTDTQ